MGQEPRGLEDKGAVERYCDGAMFEFIVPPTTFENAIPDIVDAQPDPKSRCSMCGPEF